MIKLWCRAILYFSYISYALAGETVLSLDGSLLKQSVNGTNDVWSLYAKEQKSDIPFPFVMDLASHNMDRSYLLTSIDRIVSLFDIFIIRRKIHHVLEEEFRISSVEFRVETSKLGAIVNELLAFLIEHDYCSSSGISVCPPVEVMGNKNFLVNIAITNNTCYRKSIETFGRRLTRKIPEAYIPTNPHSKTEFPKIPIHGQSTGIPWTVSSIHASSVGTRWESLFNINDRATLRRLALLDMRQPLVLHPEGSRPSLITDYPSYIQSVDVDEEFLMTTIASNVLELTSNLEAVFIQGSTGTNSNGSQYYSMQIALNQKLAINLQERMKRLQIIVPAKIKLGLSLSGCYIQDALRIATMVHGMIKEDKCSTQKAMGFKHTFLEEPSSKLIMRHLKCSQKGESFFVNFSVPVEEFSYQICLYEHLTLFNSSSHKSIVDHVLAVEIAHLEKETVPENSGSNSYIVVSWELSAASFQTAWPLIEPAFQLMSIINGHRQETSIPSKPSMHDQRFWIAKGNGKIRPMEDLTKVLLPTPNFEYYENHDTELNTFSPLSSINNSKEWFVCAKGVDEKFRPMAILSAVLREERDRLLPNLKEDATQVYSYGIFQIKDFYNIRHETTNHQSNIEIYTKTIGFDWITVELDPTKIGREFLLEILEELNGNKIPCLRFVMLERKDMAWKLILGVGTLDDLFVTERLSRYNYRILSCTSIDLGDITLADMYFYVYIKRGEEWMDFLHGHSFYAPSFPMIVSELAGIVNLTGSEFLWTLVPLQQAESAEFFAQTTDFESGPNNLLQYVLERQFHSINSMLDGLLDLKIVYQAIQLSNNRLIFYTTKSFFHNDEHKLQFFAQLAIKMREGSFYYDYMQVARPIQPFSTPLQQNLSVSYDGEARKPFSSKEFVLGTFSGTKGSVVVFFGSEAFADAEGSITINCEINANNSIRILLAQLSNIFLSTKFVGDSLSAAEPRFKHWELVSQVSLTHHNSKKQITWKLSAFDLDMSVIKDFCDCIFRVLEIALFYGKITVMRKASNQTTNVVVYSNHERAVSPYYAFQRIGSFVQGIKDPVRNASSIDPKLDEVQANLGFKDGIISIKNFEEGTFENYRKMGQLSKKNQKLKEMTQRYEEYNRLFQTVASVGQSNPWKEKWRMYMACKKGKDTYDPFMLSLHNQTDISSWEQMNGYLDIMKRRGEDEELPFLLIKSTDWLKANHITTSSNHIAWETSRVVSSNVLLEEHKEWYTNVLRLIVQLNNLDTSKDSTDSFKCDIGNIIVAVQVSFNSNNGSMWSVKIFADKSKLNQCSRFDSECLEVLLSRYGVNANFNKE